MPYQKADATRIWQHTETGVEHEVAVGFLWELVSKIEAETNGAVAWRSHSPKTEICLVDGSSFTVLGSYKRWNDRWNRYLTIAEHRTLLS